MMKSVHENGVENLDPVRMVVYSLRYVRDYMVRES